MVARLTLSQVWFNKGLLSFFFREQSVKTLEELLNRSTFSWDDTFAFIDENEEDLDLDDFEEDCYNLSVDELAERYNVALEDEEEEDED